MTTADRGVETVADGLEISDGDVVESLRISENAAEGAGEGAAENAVKSAVTNADEDASC